MPHKREARPPVGTFMRRPALRLPAPPPRKGDQYVSRHTGLRLKVADTSKASVKVLVERHVSNKGTDPEIVEREIDYPREVWPHVIGPYDPAPG